MFKPITPIRIRLKDDNVAVPGTPLATHSRHAHSVEVSHDQLCYELTEDVAVGTAPVYLALLRLRKDRSHKVVIRYYCEIRDAEFVQWQAITLDVGGALYMPST